jgi:hypothetical protein
LPFDVYENQQVTIIINATDDSGTIQFAEFRLDAEPHTDWGPLPSPMQVSVVFAAYALSVGVHDIEVDAYDPSNNMGNVVDTLNVLPETTLDTVPPSVTITVTQP